MFPCGFGVKLYPVPHSGSVPAKNPERGTEKRNEFVLTVTMIF